MLTIHSPEKDYGPVFYVGTEVYQTPTAQCIGPCNMVFAPSTLASGTTITPKPYTTSIALGTDTGVTTQLVITPYVPTMSHFWDHSFPSLPKSLN